jgi:chemotaxis family two-component system response regulator Rcp1
MSAAEQPSNAKPLTTTAHHFPRVLLIEDNAGDIELLSIAFEMNGMNALITVAEDGESGLARLREMVDLREQPDLVLLDLNMPRRSGFEVLADLAAWPVHLSPPIVVWTSSASVRDRDRCLANGATAFFTKPERIGEYIKLVESLRSFLPGAGQDAHRA